MTSSKKELAKILQCPLTKTPLLYLSPAEVLALNQRITQGEIKHHDNQIAKIALKAAFQVQGQDLFYPEEDDIICLLPEALLKGQTTLEVSATSNPQTKIEMQRFYNEIGWQEDNGHYKDASDSEDLREVSKEYIEKCHLRLNRFLHQKGKYLLDVACGPVQYSAYLTYSQNYDYRLCADISVKALKEAKKKLQEKGIYLLCDVTRLPLQNGSVDAAVSLHTLYHVPCDEQLTAFAELYRVLRKNGVSLIVYSWGRHALLMNIFLLPWKVFSRLKKSYAKEKPSLYFHAYSPRWFTKEIKAKYETELFSWRSVSVPFLKKYIHPTFFGKQILKGIFALENRFHQLMGKIGAYPLFVTIKK